MALKNEQADAESSFKVGHNSTTYNILFYLKVKTLD